MLKANCMPHPIRKVFLPVKVLQKQPDHFRPTPVIYKPCKRANPPPHLNVLYKIPGSGGKCYEFAFVRSFTRIDAEKFVCCGCRVLRVQNRPGAKGRKVPHVLVVKGMFHANPATPTNADHFCTPKITVDVLHNYHINSLRSAVLTTPVQRAQTETVEEEATAQSPLPPLIVEAEQNKPPHSSKEKRKSIYPRVSKALQGSRGNTMIRVPSVGPRKILFKLPPSEAQCYEFVEKKTRSLYFDVYHCISCSRLKELKGHKVGPIPAVHLRGELSMTDPFNPKHPHYCSPKDTADVIIQGHISKILYQNQRRVMTLAEVVNSLRIKCPSLMADIRRYEADRQKMLALEIKLTKRNLAIKISKERTERIAKEDVGIPSETPPSILEPAVGTQKAKPVSPMKQFPPEGRRLRTKRPVSPSQPILQRRASSISSDGDIICETMPVLEAMTEISTGHLVFSKAPPLHHALPKRLVVRKTTTRHASSSQPMLFPVRVMRRDAR